MKPKCYGRIFRQFSKGIVNCIFNSVFHMWTHNSWLFRVKSVWLIVNIYRFCILLWHPLLAGDNRCIWGKKDNYLLCQDGCTVFSFTQAWTDWQQPLVEPLPIYSIVQIIRQSVSDVTSCHILVKETERQMIVKGGIFNITQAGLPT